MQARATPSADFADAQSKPSPDGLMSYDADTNAKVSNDWRRQSLSSLLQDDGSYPRPPALVFHRDGATPANDSDADDDDDSSTLPTNAVSACGTVRAAQTGLKPIVDGELYLGAFRDANDAAACAALGIGAYLCVAKEVQVPSHAMAAGAPALHLRLVDGHSERLAEHIPAAVAFIEAQVAAGRRVALFCQQGRSRSVSLAVAYVQRRVAGRQEASAALEYVSQRYTRADPNLWFLQQLMSPT